MAESDGGVILIARLEGGFHLQEQIAQNGQNTIPTIRHALVGLTSQFAHTQPITIARELRIPTSSILQDTARNPLYAFMHQYLPIAYTSPVRIWSISRQKMLEHDLLAALNAHQINNTPDADFRLSKANFQVETPVVFANSPLQRKGSLFLLANTDPTIETFKRLSQTLDELSAIQGEDRHIVTTLFELDEIAEE